jgi:hypothetical protein
VHFHDVNNRRPGFDVFVLSFDAVAPPAAIIMEFCQVHAQIIKQINKSSPSSVCV